MSFRIAAPYPQLQTVTHLPNPLLSDTRQQKKSISTRRSINNTLRTYVQAATSLNFGYQFNLTREKTQELRAFIQSYYRAMWHITDHDGRIWVVYLVNNPWEFTSQRRAAPVREIDVVTLEFEGREIT